MCVDVILNENWLEESVNSDPDLWESLADINQPTDDSVANDEPSSGWET